MMFCSTAQRPAASHGHYTADGGVVGLGTATREHHVARFAAEALGHPIASLVDGSPR